MTTWNALPQGTTEAGFELQHDIEAEVINESDAYGGSFIDLIYRGGNAFMQWVCLGTDFTNTMPTLTQFGTFTSAAASGWGLMGIVGRLGSAVGQSLVMTGVTGTPAHISANVGVPKTFTALHSVLAENNNTKLLFNSKLRTVPIRMRITPYDAGSGVITWFTYTVT